MGRLARICLSLVALSPPAASCAASAAAPLSGCRLSCAGEAGELGSGGCCCCPRLARGSRVGARPPALTHALTSTLTAGKMLFMVGESSSEQAAGLLRIVQYAQTY